MTPIRRRLSQKLRELDVEERSWPGRDDGFTSLYFDGKEFAHFHDWQELDIRLGKKVIQQERLVRAAPSRTHPDRSEGSPWFELRIESAAEMNEALRLIKIAIGAKS